MRARDWAWLGAGLALLALPLAGVRLGGNASGEGTDARAQALAQELAPAYRAWAGPLWAPGPEGEGLLFTLQAALGAGVLGYALGCARTRARLSRGG